jgi:hypothetical protein
MRRLIFALLFLGGIVALCYLQSAKAAAPISPDPVIHFIAGPARLPDCLATSKA